MENKINFNVGYNTDSLYITEALAMYDYINVGYTFPIENLEFKLDEFDDFIKLLDNKYNMKLYDFSDSKKSMYRQYLCDEFIIFAQGNSKEVSCSAFCKNIDIGQDIFSTYKTFYKIDTDIKIYMTTYFQDEGRMDSSFKSLAKEEIESISDNYYPYIKNDIMYKQFFNLQENILIVAGKPGLGKSKLASSILKYATENSEIIPYDKMKDNDNIDAQFITVAYVKSTQILSEDSFWRDLENKEFDFVILDDLDYFLTSRDAEVTSQDEDNKNKFLNQFLSFTDGIEKNKTKFIITTNQPYTDIDTALLRKGRLFDILELRDLSYSEGLVIWKENNLDESDYNELYKDCERILPADIGSEVSRRLNTKIDVALEKYCTEDGISIVKQAKTRKKTGF